MSKHCQHMKKKKILFASYIHQFDFSLLCTSPVHFILRVSDGINFDILLK